MKATAGDITAALLAAHEAGDYWLHTGTQAARKGDPDRGGQLACLRHVASLIACKGAALAALHASGRKVSPGRAAAGLAIDAASHYWADRRFTLRALAVAIGKEEFWEFGSPREGHDDNQCMGTGKAFLDQAWHRAWLFAAALVIAGRERG